MILQHTVYILYMEVILYSSSRGEILNNNKKPFLLVGMMGNTFLLTKANPHSVLEKNINFQVDEGSFYSTFSRNINLLYPKKLSDVVESLGITHKPDLQHEWAVLYEVHNFSSSNYASFSVKPPAYGD